MIIYLKLPKPSGPYAVGTKNLYFVDASRPESFTSDPDDHREVAIRLWYPAIMPKDGKPVGLIENTPELASIYSSYSPLPATVFDSLSSIETHSYRGADILEADLDEADWGSYIIGEESKKEELHFAESVYRRLKQWYTSAGIYDIAGEFFFREMEAKRKGVKWWPKFWHRGWLGFVAFICGYGERPLRVIGWAVSVVLGSALIYFIIGSVWKWWAFLNSLYFSAVSFTALGYGSWVETTNDWIRGIGAFESFIGVFTIALFLITFTRKMTR